jgi:hypothetical protein
VPVVSEAQRAAMYAAAEGHSTLGIPKKVGQEFIAASHGVKNLPEHAGKKRSMVKRKVHKVRRK